MRNLVGLGVFGLGIVLLIIALDALGSSSSEVFKLGWPANSPWLLAGGITAVLAGLFLAFRGGRKA